MNTYRVENFETGHVFGEYQGESESEAIQAMLDGAGHDGPADPAVKATLVSDFQVTHEIYLTDKRDGARECVEVCLVDGAAYTCEEWDASSRADWERDDEGRWTFKGEPTPAPYLTVAVRTVQK